MKKRYLKPEEVEMIFNEARKKDKDFFAGEVSIIKTIVDTAKRNGRIGDKILLVISPYYAHIPSWQRKADLLRAKEIGEGYNKNLWEVPKLAYVNGKLICVDGMHRIFGALLARISNIVVEVIEVTEVEAIELFLGQTEKRKSMTPSDCYKASVKANKKEYIDFRDVCHAHNIQVKGDDELTTPIGIFTSISDGKRMNKETLDKILTLINNLKWAGKETESLSSSNAPYGTKVIRSVHKLYAFYNQNEKAMEEALMKKCKGATYYRDHLAGKIQTDIFDILDAEILNYMNSKAEIVPLKKGA